jgi:hypothetical protein
VVPKRPVAAARAAGTRTRTRTRASGRERTPPRARARAHDRANARIHTEPHGAERVDERGGRPRVPAPREVLGGPDPKIGLARRPERCDALLVGSDRVGIGGRPQPAHA